MTEPSLTPDAVLDVPAPGFFARVVLALRVIFDAVLARKLLLPEPKQLAPVTIEKPVDRVVEKVVEVERIVDRVVEKPVDRVVEKVVEVEKIVERVVEKPVDRVVEKIVERIVEKSRPPEEGALHLLAILQRDGRFVDFLREDIKGFPDADVGAAARLVHQGCKKAVDACFTLEPVRSEEEGAAVVVPVGFDAASISLAGDVKGEPPWRGTLMHSGWKATAVTLPERPAHVDGRVVAPAEIQVLGVPPGI